MKATASVFAALNQYETSSDSEDDGNAKKEVKVEQS